MSTKTRIEADKAAHSGEADKAKGHAKEVMGTIKEKIGGTIGDDKLEAKGRIEKADGKSDQVKGAVKEKIEDIGSKVKGSVDAVKETIAEKRAHK